MSVLPFVASAVHECVDAPVEQTVLGLEAADPKGTVLVVHATAFVRAREAAQFSELLRGVALAAPFGPGHAQQVGQIAF